MLFQCLCGFEPICYFTQADDEPYLRDITAIKGVEQIDFHKHVTFFVGENGSGKSTILEAIAIAYGFNPEGGTRNYAFSTFDSHSELCDATTLIKGVKRCKGGFFLRAETFYNFATAEFLYAEDDGLTEEYHNQSHGESFLSVMQSGMCPNGIYIYDEPEAALSPQRQLTLLMEIYKNAKAGAQFLIVTHSPILLGMPDAEILCFDDGRLHTCAYEETESYQVTKLFINDRKRLLNSLLSELSE